MPANVESLPHTGTAAKRRLRNYLLDRRFQLKYTGMVVLVTVIVAGVLGYVAYQYSRDQTEALNLQMMSWAEYMTPQAVDRIRRDAEMEDRRVLGAIIGGIFILALTLGITGIIVTHKVVGPAYKMKRLLGDLAQGHLRVEGRLRRGDELQDVFDAFAHTIESLRLRQANEIAQLDAAIARARESGTPAEVLRDFERVRDEMNAALD